MQARPGPFRRCLSQSGDIGTGQGCFLQFPVLGHLLEKGLPCLPQDCQGLLILADGEPARRDLQHDAHGDDWKWWFDGHLRFFDDTDGFGQSIARPGIGYALSENATLWAGYAWIRTSPGSADDFDEHRAWQQLTWSEQLWATKFDLRSRLEERFVETGAETGWRFRQLAAVRRPQPAAPRTG